MHWGKGHPPFSHHHTPSFSATWLWFGNCQPFVSAQLFLAFLCVSSHLHRPSSLSGERVTHGDASPKGGLFSDYDTARRSTAADSLTEGCPVNQASQWSRERGYSWWQLKDRLMDPAAGCLHTQQKAGSVFMVELCARIDYLSRKSSLWYGGWQCHGAD